MAKIFDTGFRVNFAKHKPLLSTLPIKTVTDWQIFEIVKSINENEGVTFLLAEQNTNVALRYAHYGYILESGRVVMDGEAAELRENPDVKEFYLGMSEEGRKSFRDVRSYRRRKRWLS